MRLQALELHEIECCLGSPSFRQAGKKSRHGKGHVFKRDGKEPWLQRDDVLPYPLLEYGPDTIRYSVFLHPKIKKEPPAETGRKPCETEKDIPAKTGKPDFAIDGRPQAHLLKVSANLLMANAITC